MWHRLTGTARRAVFTAQAVAGQRQERIVDTEHLLLGLLHTENYSNSVAESILTRLNISPERLRAAVPPPAVTAAPPDDEDFQMSAPFKHTIDLAWDEACRLSNNYLGTEHLLLGLIREGDGTAARVLRGQGLDLEQARREVIRLQEEGHKPGPRGEHALRELRKMPEERINVLMTSGIPFPDLPYDAQQAVEAFLNVGLRDSRMRIDVTSAVIRLSSETIGDTVSHQIMATNSTVSAAVVEQIS